jgi:hypothetical protein
MKLLILSTILLFGLSSLALADVATIREATAAGPQANAQAGIQATVDAFRADLGDPLNGNSTGSQDSGRREISWDGGDNDAAPARLPADFFNAVAPRGAVVRGFDKNAIFQVSADSTPAVPGTVSEFGNINATYPTAFSVFSSPRGFTPLNTNTIEVLFFVPGSRTPATVSGFGAVFSDVDISNTSSIEFFNANGEAIFSRPILSTPGNESLSFLGVSFDRAEVARVLITTGEQAVGANDVTQTPANPDMVMLDDFMYGEPVVVEPPAPIIASPADGSSSSSQFVTFTGMAEVGSTVILFNDSEAVGTDTSSAEGIWQISPQTIFDNGSELFTVTAANSAGTSEASAAITVTFNVESDQFVCEQPERPFDCEISLDAPSVEKQRKNITVEMDDFGSSVSYSVLSVCRQGRKRLKSSRLFFDNIATFKKPRGSRCRYRYSIIGQGCETARSGVGR